MTLDPRKYFNPNHSHFFQSIARELLFYGSRGSGKSYSVADKLIYQSLKHGSINRPTKTLVLRTSGPALKRTCIDTLINRLELFEVPYTYNKNDNILSLPGGSSFIFISISDDSEVTKVKSITDADFLHVEEANELKEDWVLTAMGNLRGGKGLYKQAILTLNPTNKGCWCYKRYIEDPVEGSEVIFSRTEDNPWISQDYIDFLKGFKDYNPIKYQTDYLGEWVSTEGLIYTNWTVVDKLPFIPDEIFYGLDFGFSQHTGLVQISICDGKLYIEEKLYKTELTISNLIKELSLIVPKKAFIYADCARPEAIEEIFSAGWRNIRKSKKGVNSVEEGINSVRNYTLHILRNSLNLKNEIESYAYRKDKNGNYSEIPIKANDHLMDAMRYAIHDHLFGFKPEAYTAEQRKKPVIDPWGGIVKNNIYWPAETINGEIYGRS